MTLQRIELGEPGRAYVLEHLRGVNILCEALASTVDAVQGDVFTWIPTDANPAQAYEFKRGGLLTENLDISRRVQLESGKGSMLAVNTLVEERASATLEALKANAGSVCICDDINPVWGSKIALACPAAVGVGQETYHLLSAESGLDVIANTLSWTDTVWHGVAAVCRAGLKVSQDRTAAAKDLATCAASVIELTCTAYDREGFVVWRRSEG